MTKSKVLSDTIGSSVRRQACFSLMVFACIQVVMDIQPLIVLIMGESGSDSRALGG